MKDFDINDHYNTEELIAMPEGLVDALQDLAEVHYGKVEKP